MKPPPLFVRLRNSIAVATFFVTCAAHAEVLDTLREFGDAAQAELVSAAGHPRGADFSLAASGAYTIVAGGADFWGNSDRGAFIHDGDRPRAAGEDFSAIVRCVSVAADPAEPLASQWGRTGIMARKDPSSPSAAHVTHVRMAGGSFGSTLMWRPMESAGTVRNNGEFPNSAANTANGSVRNTPIWLGLHRRAGTWYATWAPDEGGSAGIWSFANEVTGLSDLSGEVWVGLCHHSHAMIHPQINTAVFDNFSVDPFDTNLGDFGSIAEGELSIDGDEVRVTAGATEFGQEESDVHWEVQMLGRPRHVLGIRADIYLGQNRMEASLSFVDSNPPAGTTLIPNINWSMPGFPGGANGYPDANPAIDNGASPNNLFALAVPGSFGFNQDSYGVDLRGEIFIPGDASRGGRESVRFHDGVDDYTYLEIDGVVLINDNLPSGHMGIELAGGAQGTLDVSDPKYDDGFWATFRMIMWEGGGGDSANLVWDALDLSGADTVTGAVDPNVGTFLFGFSDGPQVPMPNDPSDMVPPLNLRVPSQNVILSETGFGRPQDHLLSTRIPRSAYEIRLLVDGVVMEHLPIVRPPLPTVSFPREGTAIALPRDSEGVFGVEYSEDLSPGSWIEIGNFFPEGEQWIFIDPDPVRRERRQGFYRLFERMGLP